MVNNGHGRSTQTRQQIGTRGTEENKRSACEELMQCAYNKIESVQPDDLSNKLRYKIQNPLITVALLGNMSQYVVMCRPNFYYIPLRCCFMLQGIPHSMRLLGLMYI
jgi:hypothetical protein